MCPPFGLQWVADVCRRVCSKSADGRHLRLQYIIALGGGAAGGCTGAAWVDLLGECVCHGVCAMVSTLLLLLLGQTCRSQGKGKSKTDRAALVCGQGTRGRGGGGV